MSLMVPTLASLPPDILAPIVDLIESRDWALLLFCGDRLLSSRLIFPGVLKRFKYDLQLWRKLVCNFGALSLLSNLQELVISRPSTSLVYVANLSTVPSIPKTLTKLVLRHVDVSEFGPFSQLEELSMDNYHVRLEELLPTIVIATATCNLTRLTLTHAGPFFFQPSMTFPPGLVFLNIVSTVFSLTDGVQFPSGLEHLRLECSQGLLKSYIRRTGPVSPAPSNNTPLTDNRRVFFAALPQSLKILELFGFQSNVLAQPVDMNLLPRNLTVLNDATLLDGYDSIFQDTIENWKSAFSGFPRTLTFLSVKLDIWGSKLVSTLEHLPRSLTHLEFGSLNSLDDDCAPIKNLTSSLTYFEPISISYRNINYITLASVLSALPNLNHLHVVNDVPDSIQGLNPYAFPPHIRDLRHITSLHCATYTVSICSADLSSHLTSLHIDYCLDSIDAKLFKSFPTSLTSLAIKSRSHFSSDIIIDIDLPNLIEFDMLLTKHDVMKLQSGSSLKLPPSLTSFSIGPIEEIPNPHWIQGLPSSLKLLFLHIKKFHKFESFPPQLISFELFIEEIDIRRIGPLFSLLPYGLQKFILSSKTQNTVARPDYLIARELAPFLRQLPPRLIDVNILGVGNLFPTIPSFSS